MPIKPTYEELEEKISLLGQITKCMGAVIVLISKDYEVIWANDVMTNIFGSVEREICFKKFKNQESICDGCGVKKVFQGETESAVHEQQGKDVHGNTIWAQIIATPVYDATGNIESALEIAIPITDQKLAELAVEKERAFSESLINSLPGVMYVFDESGHFQRWNKNFEIVTGYSRPQIVEMNPLDFIYQEDRNRVDDAITEVIKEGKSDVEASISTIDGKIIPYSLTGVRLIQNGTKYVVGMGIDISKRKESERENQVLINELKDALSQVKKLSGFLPICASCKKIRDDKGYWNQIESYIRDHSEAEFSHSICPDCLKNLYPGMKGKDD